MNVRDWLEPMLITWAKQKRRAWRNVDMSGTNILARIREEGAGASHSSGRVVQRHPEVYLGDGLHIQRAIRGMQERPAWVLHVHWIPEPPIPPDQPISVSTKCDLFCGGMKVSTYWDHLRDAYSFLDGYFFCDRGAPPTARWPAQNVA